MVSLFFERDKIIIQKNFFCFGNESFENVAKAYHSKRERGVGEIVRVAGRECESSVSDVRESERKRE